MFRVMLAVLFLGFCSPCFSESQDDLKEWQSQTLEHICYGNISLFMNEPWRALSEFQKALALVDKSDKSSSAISFLISFGQVIAYDSLGFADHCKQSIGSLLLAINEYDDENSNNENEVDDDGSVFDQHEEALEMLRSLAAVAPSADVRALLFSFIDEMAEELLPAFKFSEMPYLGKVEWDFDHWKRDVCIVQSKAWWKKFKKWCKEVAEWAGILSKGYKHVNEIKKTYEEWNNPGFVNPNTRMDEIK